MNVFVSGVQKEMAEDRRALKNFLEEDPLLSHSFSGSFSLKTYLPRTSGPTPSILRRLITLLYT